MSCTIDCFFRLLIHITGGLLSKFVSSRSFSYLLSFSLVFYPHLTENENETLSSSFLKRFNNLHLTRTLFLLLPEEKEGDQPTNSSFSLKHAKQSPTNLCFSTFQHSSSACLWFISQSRSTCTCCP